MFRCNHPTTQASAPHRLMAHGSSSLCVPLLIHLFHSMFLCTIFLDSPASCWAVFSILRTHNVPCNASVSRPTTKFFSTMPICMSQTSICPNLHKTWRPAGFAVNHLASRCIRSPQLCSTGVFSQAFSLNRRSAAIHPSHSDALPTSISSSCQLSPGFHQLLCQHPDILVFRHDLALPSH